MAFEQNTPEHMAAVEQFFNDGEDLFAQFKRPEKILTYTWRNTEDLILIMEQSVQSRHNLFLVDNARVDQLVARIEKHLCNALSKPDNQKRGVWQDYDAAYIGVWSAPNTTHSLVGVASTLSILEDSQENLIDDIAWLESQVYDVLEYNILDNLEIYLSHGTHVSTDVFTLLGHNKVGVTDSMKYIQELAEQWNYDDTFDDERSGSRVLQHIQLWTAEQEKRVISEHLNGAHVSKQRKIM